MGSRDRLGKVISVEAEEEDNGLLTSMDSFVRLRVMLDANLWAFHQARVRRRNTEKY